MIQKLIKSALIGGLVLFVWGWISWAVLPWQKIQFMKFRDEQRVARVLTDNAPTSGLYVLPNILNLQKNSLEMEMAKDNMRQGPFIFASVSLDGRNPNMMPVVIKNLILKVVAALFVSWLLMQTTKLTFNRRVVFVTIVGVVVALMGTLPYSIWFCFPSGYTFAAMFEIVFGWFFAGIAIAKLAR